MNKNERVRKLTRPMQFKNIKMSQEQIIYKNKDELRSFMNDQGDEIQVLNISKIYALTTSGKARFITQANRLERDRRFALKVLRWRNQKHSTNTWKEEPPNVFTSKQVPKYIPTQSKW